MNTAMTTQNQLGNRPEVAPPTEGEVVSSGVEIEKLEELVKVYDYLLYRPLEKAIYELARQSFGEELVSAFWKCKENKIQIRPVLYLSDDYLYFKGKFVTRVGTLSPTKAAVVLIKYFGELEFYEPHTGTRIITTKELLVQKLREMLNEYEQELEKVKKKLKKNPNSKYYNDLLQVYERSITNVRKAINWLEP